MIWNALLVIAYLVAAWAVRIGLRDWNRRKKPDKSGYTSSHIYWELPQFLSVWPFILAFGLTVASLVNVGINSSDVSTYKRSGELVELKTEQRDALAALVQDELSIEQYEAIMAATPDTDILVILGNNAATFLVEKTRLLVAINSELNALVNGLARDRIELCAWADNPLSPRLFVSPECPDPILLP